MPALAVELGVKVVPGVRMSSAPRVPNSSVPSVSTMPPLQAELSPAIVRSEPPRFSKVKAPVMPPAKTSWLSVWIRAKFVSVVSPSNRGMKVLSLLVRKRCRPRESVPNVSSLFEPLPVARTVLRVESPPVTTILLPTGIRCWLPVLSPMARTLHVPPRRVTAVVAGKAPAMLNGVAQVWSLIQVATVPWLTSKAPRELAARPLRLSKIRVPLPILTSIEPASPVSWPEKVVPVPSRPTVSLAEPRLNRPPL